MRRSSVSHPKHGLEDIRCSRNPANTCVRYCSPQSRVLAKVGIRMTSSSSAEELNQSEMPENVWSTKLLRWDDSIDDLRKSEQTMMEEHRRPWFVGEGGE